MKILFIILLMVTCIWSKGRKSSKKSEHWPKRETTKCTQENKQKAMYLDFKFKPSLMEKPMVDVSVHVHWDDIKFASWNKDKKGAVYAAYPIRYKGHTIGVGGYFGVVIHGKGGGKFLFSLWDDRDAKHEKAARALSWPLTLSTCKRNCQDCSGKLTTGTQCKVSDKSMEVGDRYEIRLTRLKEHLIINTKDYGGMPKSHEEIKEYDRKVSGGEWSVTARNKRTKEEFHVGRMLFEGDGSGLTKLGAFDEMVGCNKCNDIYHKDTRIGPFIHDGHHTRTPIEVIGSSRSKHSSCKRFGISGSKRDVSVTFEGGPGSPETFHSSEKHTIWNEHSKNL